MIFIHYSTFGDRLNTKHLKTQNFHKMMQETGISTINKKRFDLIFVKINGNKQSMSFEMFL
jgi:hypothetical protein